MLKSLQFGRALAALGVAGFHLSLQLQAFPHLGTPSIAALFAHGNAGVDFFFVLSGFIILLAHKADIGKPSRLGRYVRNRVARIYPVYWIYSAVLIVAMLAGLTAVSLPADAPAWISVVTLFRLSSTDAPLGVAWTLFYEIVFYLIFSTVIANRAVGFTVLGLWLVLILAFHLPQDRNGIATVWFSRLSLNFFIGMAACLAHERLGRKGAVIAAVLGAGMLGALLLEFDHALRFKIFGLTFALACGILISGLAALERNGVWRSWPLSYIGAASYTLYLVHVNILEWILSAAVRSGIAARVPIDVLFCIILAMAVLAACGLYSAVERPLLRLFRPRPSSATAASPVGAHFQISQKSD